MDRIRFAIVGLGGFGLKRLNSIMRSEIAKLVYVVDVNKEVAVDISKRVGVDTLSFDELLSKKDYDVAIVATPNRFHEELAIKLLEAGKDVWCEKPMSISIDSAYRMVAKSIETEGILKVGSNPRYFPNMVRAIELINQGYIGKVLFFRGFIGNEGLHLLSKGWCTKREIIGGGTLIDNGVHLIDLIRYLADEITKCHSCKLANLRWFLEDNIEDNALAIYDLLGGGVATVHSSWTEKLGYMYFEIHGENGYMCVDSRWSKALLAYGKGNNELVYEDHSKYPKMSYDIELEDFINNYNKGLHPKPTSYDGYRAVKIIVQSYLSTLTSKAVTTFDESDLALKERFMRAFNVEELYIRAQ